MGGRSTRADYENNSASYGSYWDVAHKLFAALLTLVTGKDLGGSDYAMPIQDSGGTLQTGYISVLTNGDGVDATEGDLPGNVQLVQLPDIPCRSVVIAYPKAAYVTGGLPDVYGGGVANDGGRLLFYGDEIGQFFALEVGEVEELPVSNANQIWLRDVGFDWEDFNGDEHTSNYVLVVYWRVIK